MSVGGVNNLSLQIQRDDSIAQKPVIAATNKVGIFGGIQKQTGAGTQKSGSIFKTGTSSDSAKGNYDASVNKDNSLRGESESVSAEKAAATKFKTNLELKSTDNLAAIDTLKSNKSTVEQDRAALETKSSVLENAISALDTNISLLTAKKVLKATSASDILANAQIDTQIKNLQVTLEVKKTEKAQIALQIVAKKTTEAELEQKILAKQEEERQNEAAISNEGIVISSIENKLTAKQNELTVNKSVTVEKESIFNKLNILVLQGKSKADLNSSSDSNKLSLTA